MSPPEVTALGMITDQLREIREAQGKQAETLTRIDGRTERTEGAVEKLQAEMRTVEGQVKASLGRVAEIGRALDADPNAPGWWYRSGPLAWVRRWPKVILVAAALTATAAAYGVEVALRAGLQIGGVPAGMLPGGGGS